MFGGEMRVLALFTCLAGSSFGQSGSDRHFEVAVVRMYPPGAIVPLGAQGFQVASDGLRAAHLAVRGCLQWAYNIADVDGPGWITNESYDITAKAGRPVSDAEIKQMMQTLLQERFQLKVRVEKKDVSGRRPGSE
jgi:uncharacterized protein (TIGR03435 family)